MNFEVIPFIIEFPYGGKRYRATVEQIFLSENIEIFNVIDGTKSINIKSDRPFMKKNNLRKKKIRMQALDIPVMYKALSEKIITAIEEHFRNLAYSPFNYNDLPMN